MTKVDRPHLFLSETKTPWWENRRYLWELFHVLERTMSSFLPNDPCLISFLFFSWKSAYFAYSGNWSLWFPGTSPQVSCIFNPVWFFITTSQLTQINEPIKWFPLRWKTTFLMSQFLHKKLFLYYLHSYNSFFLQTIRISQDQCCI